MTSKFIRVTKSTRKAKVISEQCPHVGIETGTPGIIKVHMDNFNRLELTLEDAEWLSKTLAVYLPKV
jgi:hypothetical protein